jgi:hypothetical protein
MPTDEESHDNPAPEEDFDGAINLASHQDGLPGVASLNMPRRPTRSSDGDAS